MTIRLVEDTIDAQDIDKLIEWLRTYPRLTKGPLTIEFEKKFSEWVGTKYSVFVNSGSSANLLMLYALVTSGMMKNRKVVVPALSWATDLAPVIQLGMHPLLVDCNMSTLSVDTEHLRNIFEKERPDALIVVSALGLSPNMQEIVNLCNEYNVILLEDNCESQGTSYNGIKLGNFGLMSSFSTYFGHIMSTIEGGVITTNDEKIYEMLIQLRSHGWSRDLSATSKETLRNEWGIDKFSELYTFYEPGFNLRATDLQAFIGIGQLEKVDAMIAQRNKNFHLFKQLLEPHVWFPREEKNSFTASFCIPVIMETEQQKQTLIDLLAEHNIECRPLISGSMGTQPFYKKLYGELILPNSSLIDRCGLYVPNHPTMSEQDIQLICELIIKASKI
jgi:CDP-6-deoxy-D-xylo-4-hexulose-3-dehydrase